MSAVRLFRASVVHARLRPRLHRFRYALTLLAIDLDRWREIGAQSPWLSADRFNLFCVRARDHGARTGENPAVHARRLLVQHGLSHACAGVVLVCQPRVLGFGFNPLALFFCSDAQGRLAAVIHEVRNTFGEHHSYVMPIDQDDVVPHRWECAKTFRVSPFLALSQHYRFRVGPLDTNLRVRILEHDRGGPVLAAALKGEREALTSSALLRVFFATPFLGVKVLAAIHWEAIRLWMKGLRPVAQT